MPDRTKKRKPRNAFAGYSIVLLFWGAVLGGFALLTQEYEDHTGRAQAEVTGVETRSDNTVYYVDYRAEGREYADVSVGGTTGTRVTAYGTTVTVAYDPADPGDPITAATIEESPWVLGAGSAALLAGAAGFAVAGAVRWIRRRREPPESSSRAADHGSASGVSGIGEPPAATSTSHEVPDSPPVQEDSAANGSGADDAFAGGRPHLPVVNWIIAAGGVFMGVFAVLNSGTGEDRWLFVGMGIAVACCGCWVGLRPYLKKRR